jgi:hypothetical protein
MAKFITEMLDEINDDPKSIVKYKDNAALRVIFEYAFIPEKKFLLPEGDPPFKPDAAPIGMSPSNLMMELRRLYVFCRKDLTPLKREGLFISLLEGVHPSEAKLLLAVKDQSLPKLYKKITHKLVADVGFVPPPPVKEKKTKKESQDALSS